MTDSDTDHRSDAGLLVLDDETSVESVDARAAAALGISEDASLAASEVDSDLAAIAETVLRGDSERNAGEFVAPGGDRFWAVCSKHGIDGNAFAVVRLEPLSVDHRAERRLGALADASKQFLEATWKASIAEAAVHAAADAFGLEMAHIYTVRDDGVLRPLAATDGAKSFLGRDGDLPSFEPGEGMLWEGLERGTPQFVESVDPSDTASALPIGAAMILPINDDAVLGIPSTEAAEFTAFDRYCAGILARLIAAAFVSQEREQELAAHEAELVRQNERLEEFASVVSHDLRNPLNVAKGRIALAQADGDTEPLDSAADALDRMQELIDDALTLAREGEDIGDRSPVSLASVVREAWENVATDNATLTTGTLGTVYGDAGRLQSLFENLFRNAVEHGSTSPDSQARQDAVEHGEEDVTVRVDPNDSGFVVADDGPGLPADLVDPFEAGRTSTNDGTGFGLAIVRRIAQAHGWRVRAESSDAGGAAFVFDTNRADEHS